MTARREATTVSVVELLRLFSTERKAIQWLERVRWNSKPVCPQCQGTDRIKVRKGHKHAYFCNACRYTFTVKTQTVMHRSPISVRLWAVAIYALLTARKSVSSLQLSKELGITQKSAWFMLHRIREACKAGQFLLIDVVEIDETYVGGKERNKHGKKKLRAGRGAVGKQAVMGLRQRAGPVKAMPVPSTDRDTLQGLVREHVAPGSTVYSDDHRAYLSLGSRAQVQHGVVRHSVSEYVNGMAHTNGIESMWALLKRGYHGTFHHVSAKHLGRYVDEFTFRLNEGNCQVDTLERMQAWARAIGGKRLTYKQLTREG